ncbi:RagB/SusD family nutrient uptake outer membrane protein [Maribellus maritimus]|uniref:RagB/SusD family nutrient uptake outer membrane protein n=1 Tax=Maribellus maritimus TaxID=2870838 RepID=UPI001EEA78DD|nr:RagB/SusD family nutrient uptake outer membrane protein [Maribellus maritimus]MCG6187207.1 RagB/SusD family nutrient uptake outer membrane protein [Maribellus maritimus]
MKINKYINRIIPVLTGILFLTVSCEDRLEINPWQSLSDQQALTTLSGIENAVTGCFDALQDENLLGTNVIQNAEIKSQYIHWQGSYTSYTEMSQKDIQPDNTDVSGMWIAGYDGVNRCNKVIEAVDNGLDEAGFEEVKDRIKGEALFCRGVLYFEMVRSYGLPYSESSSSDLGIVIKNTPSNDLESATEQLPRSSVQEIYSQAIADLKEAESLLLETSDAGRANKYSCRAYLSRIYLQMKDYSNAASYANQVIQSGNYTLDTDPTKVFGESFTSEMVFGIIHTSTDNFGSNNESLNNYWNPNERGDIIIKPSTIALYSENDLRLGWFFEQDDSWWTNKHIQNDYNAPVIRLAEMYLNRAEALAEIGTDTDEALTMLNTVRLRAGLDELSDLSVQELITAIQEETIREFMAEGHSLYDLERWRKNIGYSNIDITETVPWNDSSLLFPIPQREMDVNDNLVQNPL